MATDPPDDHDGHGDHANDDDDSHSMSEEPELPAFVARDLGALRQQAYELVGQHVKGRTGQPAKAAGPSTPLRGDTIPALQPGVEGYRIAEDLGVGSYGIVVKADVVGRSNECVAIKFFKSKEVGVGAALERFRQEYALLRQLDACPQTVSAYEEGEWNGNHYFVLEYAGEVTLRAEFETAGGPLPLSTACELFHDLCEGVAYLHTTTGSDPVVHRDLKPANICVNLKVRPHEVKILDFGIAKGDLELTRTGQQPGTPVYMAPEQLKGESMRAAGLPTVDVFALGVILAEILTGEALLDGKMWHEVTTTHDERVARLRATRPEVPQTLWDVVARALSHDPGSRQQDASAMLDEFQRAWDRPPGVDGGASSDTRTTAVAFSAARAENTARLHNGAELGKPVLGAGMATGKASWKFGPGVTHRPMIALIGAIVVSIGVMFHLQGAETSPAPTVTSLRKQLSDRLLREAGDARDKTVYGVWTYADIIAALDPEQRLKLEHQDYVDYIERQKKDGAHCWMHLRKNDRSHGPCHHGATAWVLIALSNADARVSSESWEYLLGQQHHGGWWSLIQDTNTADTNASSYSTALTVLAIDGALERSLIPDGLRDRAKDAIKRATKWMLEVKRDGSCEWLDYPHQPATSSRVLTSNSGLIMHALDESGYPLPTTLKATCLDSLMAWLLEKNGWLHKESGVAGVHLPAGYRFDMRGQTNYADTTTHNTLAWVLMGINAAYTGVETSAQKRAQGALDAWLQRSNDDHKKLQMWQRAEYAYVLRAIEASQLGHN